MEDDESSSKRFKGKAEKFLSSSTDQEENLNLMLLIAQLQTFISRVPYTGFYYPMSYRDGVQVEFQNLLK